MCVLLVNKTGLLRPTTEPLLVQAVWVVQAKSGT